MKTKKEIVFSIIEYVSGFHVTDDSPYDFDLISDKVDDVRASLIKQQYNALNKIDDDYYQMINLTIKEAKTTEENDYFSISRFHVDFSPLLSGVGWENIKYLGKKSMLEKFNRRSIDGYTAARGRHWSRNMVDYTVIGPSRAIIRNEKVARNLMMVALFKSPDKVPGNSIDSPYPVPDPFKLEMIVKQDIMAVIGIPPDEKNDARHNSEQLTGQQ